MARQKSDQPTDRELAILRILWDSGPSTVRQVNDAMNLDGDTGYTTTLKLMQIMADKGLVRRDETQRTHVYSALAKEESTQRQILGSLMDRAFGGSARKLVMQALAAKELPQNELDEIKQLLDQMEGGQS